MLVLLGLTRIAKSFLVSEHIMWLRNYPGYDEDSSKAVSHLEKYQRVLLYVQAFGVSLR